MKDKLNKHFIIEEHVTRSEPSGGHTVFQFMIDAY